MNTKIKWGIIGLGKIAHKFASDLLLSENAVLHGVASRSLEKAKTFSTQYKSITYYGSYEGLVKDHEIDVVYIATPHTFHFENTMLCFQNNKSVLCEKPLGISTQEVQTMIKEATSRNLFFMEAICTRFMPATEKLIELFNQNIIGDVISIHADFGFKAPIDLKGRLYNKKLGGGSLLDIGIYPIYLSLLILGVPTNIKAMARMTSTNVDSYCAMLFDYKNSAKAMLESTIEVNTPTEAIIYGSNGTIKVHNRFPLAEKLSIYQDDKLKERFELNYTGNGYVHEIEEVNNCLLMGKLQSNKLPHQLSLDLITTIDRVKKQIGLSY